LKVGLTLVLGIVLSGVGLRVWLVPPLIGLTPYVHLLLIAAWIPVLVVCALRRPQGKVTAAILLAVVSLIVSVFWCAVIGPIVSLGASEGGFSSSVECDETTLPGGRVRYTCRPYATSDSVEFVLEGRAGWPFARVVEP
jgi:hypothetical protein